MSEKQVNDCVSEIDRSAEQAIDRHAIRRAYPGHSILAEEGSARKGRLPVGRRPLDGTTNYLHGFPQFAVSIAQMHRGRLESAVVY